MLSKLIVTVSPEIVDDKPVPPEILNVSEPKDIVVVEDESSEIVKLPLTVEKDKLPEPSVINTWPFVPSVPGSVNVTFEDTALGAFNAT